MLKCLLLFCCILSTTVCWGQKRIQKIIDKELNLVTISDSLYVERFEVTYWDYDIFEFFLKKNSNNTTLYFSKIYKDELNWSLADSNALHFYNSSRFSRKSELTKLVYLKKDIYDEFRFLPSIKHYPMVGITHEQAKLYCQWKSKEVTKNINKYFKEQGFNQKYTFNYRLPTQTEWILAFGKSKEGYNSEIKYSKNTSKIVKKLGFKKIKNNTYYDLTINQKLPFKYREFALYENEVNFIGSVYAHSPNPLGLYNMKGNVAEMIDEVGIAMGGSWRNTLEEIDKNLSQNYICPSEWLGFRVFCEIKEVNNDKIMEEEYKINYNSACEYVYQRNDLNNPKYYEPKYQTHAMDSLYKLSNYDSLEISKLDDKYISRVGDKIKLDFEQCYDTVYLGFTRYYSRFFVRRCHRSSTFINTSSVEFSKLSFKNTLFGIFIILYVDDKKTIKYVVIDNRNINR